MRRRAVLCSIAAMSIVAASCSAIPTDSTPSAVDESRVPSDLTDEVEPRATTTPPFFSTTPAMMWFVHSDDDGTQDLRPCEVDVQDADTDEQLAFNILGALIDQGPADDDCPSGYSNDVPGSLVIIEEPDLSDGTLRLNLAGLGDVSGGAQRRAVGQIVFTLTELEDVDAVRFFAHGEPTDVPVEDGTAEAGSSVSRADFPDYRRIGQIHRELEDADPDTLADYFEELEGADDS